MKRLGIALFVCVGIAAGAAAWADGCFFAPVPTADEARDVRAPEQKAFITYQDGTEDLVVQVTYEGDAEEFAWVLPLPARPNEDYGKVGGALFHELSELTAPPPTGGRGAEEGEATVPTAPGVVVLQRKEVGDFETVVLAATDPNALVNWLKGNDFAQPPEAEPIIKQYVDEAWYFVAARIKAPTPEAAERLRSGTIAPVHFTFSSDRIVYPMRLTAINPGSVEVLLYIAGTEFVSGPNLGEEYAQRVDLGAMAADAYPTLREFVSGEFALTKLRGVLEAADMQQDLVLQPKPGGIASIAPVVTAAGEDPTTRTLLALAPVFALAGGVILAGAIVLWWSRRRAPAEPPGQGPGGEQS